jgi:hypothetical protein
MATLLDTNLWIGLIRSRSPHVLKRLIAPLVDNPHACVAEPIVFEVLRGATDDETVRLVEYFESLPLLASPVDLWDHGLELGRACRKIGLSAGSIDLLIAAVAIHHRALLITFDKDFEKMSSVSD